MSWQLPSLTTLCLVVFGVWTVVSRPTASPRLLLAHLGLAVLVLVVDALGPSTRLYDAARHTIVNATPAAKLNMVLTLAAVAWILHRSWQTLWKPVPELISILGVDIPQPPDVCLSGIGPDSATLSWTKPASNRPVTKYLIQVNGIDVGHCTGNETAITVTGLRPNHFYNLRVVAVGPNNFRAGGLFIRLRTFGKDGKPRLGGERMPASFVDPEYPRFEPGESVWLLPTPEPVPVTDSNTSSAAPRDLTATALGQRRNTLNRRHSPLVASPDTSGTRTTPSADPELTLAELNEKFEGIRKDIDDTQALYAKDETDFQQQEEELKRDKDRKRQLLREKEEHTAQLKAMMRLTMEQMRAAEKERTKKEQQLKDKETKRSKICDSCTKLESELERMKTGRQDLEAHKAQLVGRRDRDVQELDKDNAELHANCVKLEAELKDKGKQLQDIKATRAPLSTADDERWREDDQKQRRRWEASKRELHHRLLVELKDQQHMIQQIRDLDEQLSVHKAGQRAYYGQPGSSSVDFDAALLSQPNRQTLGANSLPPNALPPPDPRPSDEPNFQGSMGYSDAALLASMYADAAALDAGRALNAGIEFKTSSGPLSPSAQTLLPSNIFEESEDTESAEANKSNPNPPLPERPTTGKDSQSSLSAGPSLNAFPSPRGSVRNVPFLQYSERVDGSSYNVHASPPSVPAAGHRIASFLSTLQRGRTAKNPDAAGPPIGSLKPAQSQSFPSLTDENESLENRRRLNISSWVGRLSPAQDVVSPGVPGIGPGPLSTLRPNTLKGSQALCASDREGESSRPASIASSDFPRPSTDSGSIWGAPGDALVLQKNRLWSPKDGRWPSRGGSRRPSLQGSNPLTTTLASADDEILDLNDLLNPETLLSQVGVIGSRPPGSSRLVNPGGLNPAAPAFMAHIFSRQGKDKGVEAMGLSTELTPRLDSLPPGSGAGRDARSVRTQTSVAESHESLQLDAVPYNASSDPNLTAAASGKDSEKSVRKLFRRGSSSKFSLSSRLGKESSLFKKGSGSASNSERNAGGDHRSSVGDAEDVGDDLAVLGRSFDSAASSASLGPPRGKEGREGGRKGSWRFSMSSMKKKGKETPVREAEPAATED